jgi:hypothetical protein
MFKHQITPLSKGGQTQVHAGKGAQSGVLLPHGNRIAPAGSPVGQPPPTGATMNDYAKATPMSAAPAAPAPDGLGTGNWPGIGQ